jgi:hypothetical protein
MVTACYLLHLLLQVVFDPAHDKSQVALISGDAAAAAAAAAVGIWTTCMLQLAH